MAASRSAENPVEKVMIEGDDLFNQNYTIGTRNIRADMIDKIQAIDRYQDNPLFKGISESERMVLNLTIREDKKYKISGSTTTGAGFGGRARGQTHINLISITKKSKSYILGNANNTGNNALESTGASDYPVARLRWCKIYRQSACQRNRSMQDNPWNMPVCPQLSV
jgi:hypothetical protein